MSSGTSNVVLYECVVLSAECICLDNPKSRKRKISERLNFNNKLKKQISKINEISRLSPVELKVFYDFPTNIATLSFCENDERSFRLKSIKLKYGYEGQEIDRIECNSNSNLYKFSTKDIDRHVLYNTYSCKATIDERKTYSMEYDFTIPHFETKTEIVFKFLPSQYPSTPIVNIFNKKFIDCPFLSSREKELLSNLQ